MPAHPILNDLLKKARRRVLWQLILDKGSLALVIMMGGAVLLLLVGTQLLDWYWPVLLAIAGLGAGLYQLRGKIPSQYRVAQRIDRKLELADALSTALHFSTNPEPARESICRLQREDAESKAATINLSHALPTRRSRYMLPAVGLAAAVVVLLVIRFAALGTLDLDRSLVAMALSDFFTSPTELAKNDVRKGNVDAKPFEGTDAEKEAANQEKLPESLLEPNDPNDPSGNPDDGTKGDTKGDQNKQDQNAKDGKDGNDGKQKDDQDDKEGANNNDNPGQQDSKNAKPKNESMMDKLRDALANLLNKNKSDTAKQQSQQNSKGQQQKAEDQDKNQNEGESADSQPGQQQDPNAKNQGDAKGGENPNKPPPDEASANAGDKVGQKAIKDAQALQAMGKISELIGKRNATLQGEMMVEVGETKQVLKTQFSNAQATHADAGGEIHRDEVPLMFQQYVEQYFAEIHKESMKPAKSKTAAK